MKLIPTLANMTTKHLSALSYLKKNKCFPKKTKKKTNLEVFLYFLRTATHFTSPNKTNLSVLSPPSPTAGVILPVGVLSELFQPDFPVPPPAPPPVLRFGSAGAWRFGFFLGYQDLGLGLKFLEVGVFWVVLTFGLLQDLGITHNNK